ncbi:hypothetical protein M514_28043 [Trichuris suis]|uniref:Uncharacterized protein n=1 Tax=Trichuris suis TaxID=68888 RepID=A0A085MRC9_9BILA|nr:hypothetical protein M514_28043 [Trichuris suis]
MSLLTVERRLYKDIKRTLKSRKWASLKECFFFPHGGDGKRVVYLSFKKIGASVAFGLAGVFRHERGRLAELFCLADVLTWGVSRSPYSRGYAAPSFDSALVPEDSPWSFMSFKLTAPFSLPTIPIGSTDINR